MPCECPVDLYVLFKDTLVSGAALFGVFIAANGLKTWKAQLKGTVEYDLTRRLLRGTYRLRDAFAVVRNPVMWANEFVPTPPNFQGGADDAHFFGLAAAYEKRWSVLVEARRELEAELLEAEVIWDRSVRAPYTNLFKLQGELSAYLSTYLKVQDPKTAPSMRESYSKVLSKQRDVLYASFGDEDAFATELDLTIKAIEAQLKPHLRK